MNIRPQFRQGDPPIPGNLPMDVEVARPICACNRTGALTLGQQARGKDGYSVDVQVRCPAGQHPVGVWHTHPGGIPEPSQADMREMRRLGLKHMCITVPETGETRCHRVD